jgi:hypothetical protein
VTAGRYDYSHPEVNQLLGQHSQQRVVITCPTVFDPDVLAFSVALLAKSVVERGQLLAATRGWRSGAEESDDGNG